MTRSSTLGALALTLTCGLTHGLAQADDTKPSLPSNVNATALDDSSVRVTWNKPWDDTGVVGYNIYRNRSYYSTVHHTTNFVDTNVNSGQTYDYAIVAFDEARNYTRLSASDEVTPGGGVIAAAPRSSGNGEAPSVPQGLSAEAQGNDRVKLSWNAASANASGYNVYRDGSYRTSVRSTEWTDTGLAAGREYRYNVVAFSADAHFSDHSADVRARTSGGEVSAPSPAPQSDSGSGSVPAGYRLVFSDEFNGSSLDSAKWNSSYRWGPNWTINNERQYYVDTINNPDFGHSPFSFDGNHLTITATKTPEHLKSSANWKNYLSGALTTHNKFTMRYGYAEMRAKMPAGQGLWPAFWMLHSDDGGNRPEIDIMEFLGRDRDTIYNVYHWYEGHNGRGTPSFEANGPDYTAGFHTFGMKWEPGRIIWYVDGREANRYEAGHVSNEDMYLLLNLAMGGSWGGEPDSSTPLPARYVIDYVRAYAAN